MRRRGCDDDGSTLPLTAFYAFLALVLILLVVSATSLYLERKRLFTLADGAAIVGAEAFDLADVRVVDGELRAELAPGDVATAVDEYLGVAPVRFDDLAVREATTTDGRSATVTLAATWHPPLMSLLVPDGVRIEVTSIARSVFD